MAGDIARLLMRIFDPKQAQWEDVSNQMSPDASPYTWQKSRESVYGKGEDIELPAEGTKLGKSLQRAAEGLKSLRSRGIVK